MHGKKVHLSGPGKLVNAPGAPPRRYGAPIAIMFLPGPGFQVIIQGNRMRPRPQMGEGLARGGDK